MRGRYRIIKTECYVETNKPWLPASRPARLSASSSREWGRAFVVRFRTRFDTSRKYIYKELHRYAHRLICVQSAFLLDKLISTTFLFILIYKILIVRIHNCTSTRLYWHSITRPGAFAARASGRVAPGALSTRAQLALGFRDARKVALLVPPWCFRPARQRTPERGREEKENEGANGKRMCFTKNRKLRSDGKIQLPFKFHAGSVVIDSIDVLVLQVTKSLKLHRVIKRRGCDRTVFSFGNAKRGVRTYLVHFCEE